MKNKNEKKNTSLPPIQVKEPKEEARLRRLSDDDIIRGFQYLLRKDKTDK